MKHPREGPNFRPVCTNTLFLTGTLTENAPACAGIPQALLHTCERQNCLDSLSFVVPSSSMCKCNSEFSEWVHECDNVCVCVQMRVCECSCG